MALIDELNENLKTAMREHDTNRKTLLRSIIGDAKNAQIEGIDINDDKQLHRLIQKAVKEREASAAEYMKIVDGIVRSTDPEAVGRARENAEHEKWEAEQLRAFLPKEASLEQLGNIVDIVITETGAYSMKQMGQVMGAVKQLIAENLSDYTVDMGTVSRIVRERLK